MTKYRNTIAKYCCRIWGSPETYYSDEWCVEDAWEKFKEMIKGSSTKVILYECREYSKYTKSHKSYEFECLYYHPIHMGYLGDEDELNITEEDTERTCIPIKTTHLTVHTIKDLHI